MLMGLLTLVAAQMTVVADNSNYRSAYYEAPATKQAPVMDIKLYEFGRTIEQMIADSGFDGETHYVYTVDLYKLIMHRIQPPKKYRNKKVVLFLHQMDGSSMDFLMNSEEQSMPLQLTRKGFDVWLLNTRGNFYSFESKNTTADKSDFWSFGPEDMGTKDLPAAIEYILQVTKEKTVTIVGLEQGS